MRAGAMGIVALVLAAVNIGTTLAGSSLTVVLAGGFATLTIALLAVAASIQDINRD